MPTSSTSTSAPRGVITPRHHKINAIIGKCNFDDLEALCDLLVTTRRSVAEALDGMLHDRLARSTLFNAPVPPSMPKGPTTLDIGGVKIPVGLGS